MYVLQTVCVSPDSFVYSLHKTLQIFFATYLSIASPFFIFSVGSNLKSEHEFVVKFSFCDLIMKFLIWISKLIWPAFEFDRQWLHWGQRAGWIFPAHDEETGSTGECFYMTGDSSKMWVCGGQLSRHKAAHQQIYSVMPQYCDSEYDINIANLVSCLFPRAHFL